MSDSRRDFVKAAAGLGLAASAVAADPIPRRKLGKTGLEVTIVGLAAPGWAHTETRPRPCGRFATATNPASTTSTRQRPAPMA